MKISLKIASAGVSALVLASSAMVLGATSASASTAGNGGVVVGWQPDTTNDLGVLDFYDAAGQQITSGSITASPMAAFYASNAVGAPSGYVATTTPEAGNSATWSGTQPITTTQAFPKSGLPGVLAGFAGAVVADNSGGSFQTNQINTFPNGMSTTGYANLYEVRMYVGSDNTHWYAADIQVSGTTWTQVFPVQTAPTVTVSSTSANPSITGTAINLTATLGTALAGKVQFNEGGTPVGSPVAVSGSTASISVTPTQGAHSYSASFTPTPGTAGLASASTAPLSRTVNNPATNTTTNLNVSAGTYANDPATFTATVIPASGAPAPVAGSVVFKDGTTTVGSGVAGASNGTAGANNAWTLTSSSLGAGQHDITAVFTPADATAFNGSTSSVSSFTYGSSPTVGPAQNANITLTVDAGIVTITTPYTSGSPFTLGPVGLDPTASYLVASSLFPAAGDNPITITDTRAGDLTWHATMTSSDLTGVAVSTRKINGQNLGFAPNAATYPAGNALFGKVGVTTTAPAAGVAPGNAGLLGLKGGPTFAAVNAGQSGVGTAYIKGLLSLKAPTSTVADTYNGVLTLTVIGS